MYRVQRRLGFLGAASFALTCVNGFGIFYAFNDPLLHKNYAFAHKTTMAGFFTCAAIAAIIPLSDIEGPGLDRFIFWWEYCIWVQNLSVTAATLWPKRVCMRGLTGDCLNDFIVFHLAFSAIPTTLLGGWLAYALRTKQPKT